MKLVDSAVWREAGRSALVALWFMFLSFPLLAVRVHAADRSVEWRLVNLLYVGGAAFGLSWLWRQVAARRGVCEESSGPVEAGPSGCLSFPERGVRRTVLLAGLSVFLLVFPWLFSSYRTGIATTAMMYVVLGLGLNIVVGLAGLLNLGYVAFYAVGAYAFALLNRHLGVGFWVALPLGAGLAALCGFLLGLPVLRLKGDYLAIVTLGFAEILRLVLENWNEVTAGPSGIANLPGPALAGVGLQPAGAVAYLYYIMLVFVVGAVLVVRRIEDSRVGRALVALREDEIACRAMGVNTTALKLSALTIGAAWAGAMGVVFAAKTTFVNPASFTFLESAMVLSMVVLGGLGSIRGVIVAALILILLPEYLRVFAGYRMLLFGVLMVLMMVFRPQGLLAARRKVYLFGGRQGDGG